MLVEFEPICSSLFGIGVALNTVSRYYHVPQAERNVRNVKYRVWSVLTNLLFRKVPDHTIIEIVLGQVLWLNLFPNKYGVSNTMIPYQIMSYLKIDKHCNCLIVCGRYAQTHEQHGKNMTDRTVGSIALRPTGNRQGGY